MAGAVLSVLVVVGIVLATRTPQEATAVSSPLVGQAAPAFSGRNLATGASVALDALRGHYVVLNFFASWCAPCQQEAPDLSRFDYEQAHRGGGADMVSIVFHDSDAGARTFLRENGDLWPAIGDPGGTIADHYGVTGPPTTVVIDPSGRVTAVLQGPATQQNLDTALTAARATQASDG